jgi:hypothetical protein
VKSAADRDTKVAEITAHHDEALGQPDRVFERRYLVAYARGNLMQIVHDQAEELRRGGIPVDSETLRSAVLMIVGRTMRSAIAIDLIDDALATLIDLAVADYLRTS